MPSNIECSHAGFCCCCLRATRYSRTSFNPADVGHNQGFGALFWCMCQVYNTLEVIELETYVTTGGGGGVAATARALLPAVAHSVIVTLSLLLAHRYVPNAAELADPLLYARNVRRLMAAAMDVPVTDHSLGDFRLMDVAQPANISQTFMIKDLKKKYGLEFEQVKRDNHTFPSRAPGCRVTC